MRNTKTKSITGRDGTIVCKALAYAISSILQLPLRQREVSDMLDMRALLDHLSNGASEYYIDGALSHLSGDAFKNDLDLDYPSHLPVIIPVGQVLVHNSVRPAWRQGTRGFRYWLQRPAGNLEVCPCQWAPELGEHYRIREVPNR